VRTSGALGPDARIQIDDDAVEQARPALAHELVHGYAIGP